MSAPIEPDGGDGEIRAVAGRVVFNGPEPRSTTPDLADALAKRLRREARRLLKRADQIEAAVHEADRQACARPGHLRLVKGGPQ